MSIVGIVVLGIGDDDCNNLNILGGYAGTRQCDVQQRYVADSRGLFHSHIFQWYSADRPDRKSLSVPE